MELVEIEGLFKMDCGSPDPIIVSNGNELLVSYLIDTNNLEDISLRCSILFESYLNYSFGSPNDETIQGHPYYKLGLQPYAFFELKNSGWIEKLKDIDKVHPYYNENKWEDYKHFILTFHDNIFECVAKGFEMSEENKSILSSIEIMLPHLKS
jgi:hypothetical protein